MGATEPQVFKSSFAVNITLVLSFSTVLSDRMEGKQNRERTILQCQMEQKIRTQVFKALISRQRMAVHQERYQALQAQQGLYHGRGLEVIAEKEIIGQRRLDENKDTKTDMQKYYVSMTIAIPNLHHSWFRFLMIPFRDCRLLSGYSRNGKTR